MIKQFIPKGSSTIEAAQIVAKSKDLGDGYWRVFIESIGGNRHKVVCTASQKPVQGDYVVFKSQVHITHALKADFEAQYQAA